MSHQITATCVVTRRHEDLDADAQSSEGTTTIVLDGGDGFTVTISIHSRGSLPGFSVGQEYALYLAPASQEGK